MNFRPRSLFVKIFFWFCLTGVVSITLVFSVAALTGSQPFGQRYVAVTQDLYAHTAVDLYTTGGPPALRNYFRVLQSHSGIEGHLIALPSMPAANGVLGEALPAQDNLVLRQALSTGRSAAHFDRRFWTAASVVDFAPGGARYIFLLSAPPLRGFLDGTFFNLVAPRFAGVLLLTAVFCLLLARHITRPVRVLESAAARMAAGDLGVRTVPAMGRRSDELAAMAAAFDAMAERIESLLRVQRQTLADISHELRSPLTRISVSLELLRRGEFDVIEPMQQDLDDLNRMIGQVLELSRFELQQPLVQPEELDLASVLEDVVESANYEGRSSGKTVTLSVLGGGVVRGDREALHCCIENIVRNALQYSPVGGIIHVWLEPVSAGLLVRVEDTGPGVPEPSLPSLFMPFFRVPGSSATNPHGSGLGLSISARIASRYGGSIVASNRVPHGLSVQVTLPVAPR